MHPFLTLELPPRATDIRPAPSGIRLELHGHSIHFVVDDRIAQLPLPGFWEAAPLAHHLLRVVLV